MFEFMFVNRHSSSSVLNEANLLCLFSESLSAKHELVLSDETEGAAGNSAGSGVLSVLSGVGFKLVRHLCVKIVYFINKNPNRFSEYTPF